MSYSTQMTSKYAILHKQICDNFPGCPAMIACQDNSRIHGRQPAIYMKDGEINIKREDCTGCTLCLEKCGLFRIVPGLYAELKYQEEFDNDPRNKMDFSTERFGCDIINKQAYLLNDLHEVNDYILNTSNKVNILEFVDEAHVMCPFQAIEVDYILKQFPYIGEYKKFVITSTDLNTFEEIERNYQISQFPAVLFLHNGIISAEPILTEFRVSKEDERILVQVNLEVLFSQRMNSILGHSL